MTNLRNFAVTVATLIVATAMSITVGAQTGAKPTVTSQSATISLSIAVPIKHFPMGQKPWVYVTVTNLGNEEINYPWDRVYVEGPNGEPPTTLYQRQVTNRLRPGEPPIRIDDYGADRIASGQSFTAKYDLSAFYEFNQPGKYTVYVEVVDSLAAKAKTRTDNNYWVRSPVATFELEPSQTGAKPTVTSQSATMNVSIAVLKHIPMGQKPWVSLTVGNLGNEEINYPWDRVYVEGPNGEPPTTLRQRQVTDRLRPGESPLRMDDYGACHIAPGTSFTGDIDLSALYEFKEPGKYTVYVEVVDSLAAKAKAGSDNDYRLRSPVATFELEPSAR